MAKVTQSFMDNHQQQKTKTGGPVLALYASGPRSHCLLRAITHSQVDVLPIEDMGDESTETTQSPRVELLEAQEQCWSHMQPKPLKVFVLNCWKLRSNNYHICSSKRHWTLMRLRES